jgi:hypothetical protein
MTWQEQIDAAEENPFARRRDYLCTDPAHTLLEVARVAEDIADREPFEDATDAEFVKLHRQQLAEIRRLVNPGAW